MKKVIILLLIPFAFLEHAINAGGRLGGKGSGKIGRITFDEEEYAIFLIEGQEIGGKECDMNGEKRTLTYVVNLDAEPIEIDFIIKKIASGEEMRLVGIAAFKDSNTMDIAIHDKERPTNFESDDAIVLKRVVD